MPLLLWPWRHTDSHKRYGAHISHLLLNGSSCLSLQTHFWISSPPEQARAPSLSLHPTHVFPNRETPGWLFSQAAFFESSPVMFGKWLECMLGLYHLHFILREVYLRQVRYLFYKRKLRKWSVRASRASFNWTTVEFRYSFQIFSYCWIYYAILQKKKIALNNYLNNNNNNELLPGTRNREWLKMGTRDLLREIKTF